MEGIVERVIQEYREGDLAVKTTVISFLCIPIFSYKKTSTNRVVVNQFNKPEERIKIKGFNNETED